MSCEKYIKILGMVSKIKSRVKGHWGGGASRNTRPQLGIFVSLPDLGVRLPLVAQSDRTIISFPYVYAHVAQYLKYCSYNFFSKKLWLTPGILILS
jgi:hypothetical protein